MKDFDIKEFLDEEGVGYNEGSHGKELILHECPYCSKAKKLYIESGTGIFICFRCGEKGSPVKLVSAICDISEKQAFKMMYGGVKSVTRKRELIKDNIADGINEIRLPKAFININENKEECSEAIEYLKSRGMTDKDIQDVDAYFWKDGVEYLKNIGRFEEYQEKGGLDYWKNQKRVVFVNTVLGSPFGWVARDITGEQKPKTLNSEGGFRSKTIWNYDNIQPNSDVIITEGVFDAVKAGLDRSVAILGSHMSDEQIELLFKKDPKHITLFLDRDTTFPKNKQKNSIIIDLAKRIHDLYLIEPTIIRFPEMVNEDGEQMDAGDLNRDEIDKIISDESNHLKIPKMRKI